MSANGWPPTTIRVASVNWNNGGIAPSGDDAPWRKTVKVLRVARPHIVFCQELTAPDPGVRLGRHLRRTANALGMELVLGPIVPGARTALHTGMFINTRAGFRIEDVPYLGERFGGFQHAWCRVELGVPTLPQPLDLCSVHLPARSAPAQVSEAYSLVSALVNQQLVLVGGDFNGYARGGPPSTTEELEQLPGHLQVTRCQGTPGALTPNYAVDDLFTGRGKLIDVAAYLPAERRQPPDLTETGTDGGGRIDRFYASLPVADTVEGYRLLEIGSDHLAPFIEINLPQLAALLAVT